MSGPTPKPYFLYPFCIDGVDGTDTTTISNTGSNPGTVSYEYGFTAYYELISTDPNSLPVPRQQFNQLMFDVTSAIQQLQNYGVPNWVASGSGGPANYPKNAFVLYSDGNVYVSAVSSNTSVPGTDNNWILFNPAPNPIVTGTILDFGGISAPSGYLLCDNTAQSRSTYANLFSAITFSQTCILSSSVNVTVVDSSNMFISMPVEGTDIPANTTVADIIDSTHITISNAATGSGSETLTFFPWGNGDGSSTFNMPDLRARVTMGAKGGVITGSPGIGQNVGQKGGGNSYTLNISDIPDHMHDFTVPTYGSRGTGSSLTRIQNNPLNQLFNNFNLVTGGIDGYSTQTAIPTLQGSAITNKIIKT